MIYKFAKFITKRGETPKCSDGRRDYAKYVLIPASVGEFRVSQRPWSRTSHVRTWNSIKVFHSLERLSIPIRWLEIRRNDKKWLSESNKSLRLLCTGGGVLYGKWPRFKPSDTILWQPQPATAALRLFAHIDMLRMAHRWKGCHPSDASLTYSSFRSLIKAVVCQVLQN